MGEKSVLEVVLANPRGFCAGVARAISIVERSLDKFSAPVYVHNEIVHNQWVVSSLKSKGTIFVTDVDDVPEGSVLIYSAHGVSRFIEERAHSRHLYVVDATCPLVKRVHRDAQRQSSQGRTILLIGHKGHPEVIGTEGQVSGDIYVIDSIDDLQSLSFLKDKPVAYVTQTTLSLDETRELIKTLEGFFTDIIGPDLKNICYATQNRQQAIHRSLEVYHPDAIVIMGSASSSNSNRLREIAEKKGYNAYLVDDIQSFCYTLLNSCSRIVVSAGASAPAVMVETFLEYLRLYFSVHIIDMEGDFENVRFHLPQELF